MTISPSLRYQISQDAVAGFQEVGKPEDRKEVADSLVVFMLRGNMNRWSQIVGYYLVKHGISPEDLATIVKDVITKVEETKIEVRYFAH